MRKVLVVKLVGNPVFRKKKRRETIIVELIFLFLKLNVGSPFRTESLMRKVLRRAAHSWECCGGWGWSIGELSFLYIQLSGEWKYLSFILLYVSVPLGMAELHLARELRWEEVMGSSPKTLVLFPMGKKVPALHEGRDAS